MVDARTVALVQSPDGLSYSAKTCACLLGVGLKRLHAVVDFLGLRNTSHVTGQRVSAFHGATVLSREAYALVRRELKRRGEGAA